MGAVLLLTVVAIWGSWSQAEPGANAHQVKPANPVSDNQPPLKLPDQWPPPSPYGAEPELNRVPLLPVDQSLSARHSLADARLNGDARTPPIERSVDSVPGPSAAELADPKAYAMYEVRQNLRVYAAFYQAAQRELPLLRANIERGKQAGIAPEKIAKAEEKYRRLSAEQANLLQQHPELRQLSGASSPVKP
jgi:hypothetical protein